jgi:SAM-dependent methyltransferase
MSRFAPDIQLLYIDEKPVLWHRKTGRHLLVSREILEELERWTPGLAPPPDLKGLAPRLLELGFLVEAPLLSLEKLIPARSRLALLTPEGLWHADPMVRPQGGHAWRMLPFDKEDAAIWRACNGSRSLLQVASQLSLPIQRVQSLMESLCLPSVQAIQLRVTPLSRRDPSLERILCPKSISGPRQPDQYGISGETTLEDWHARIQDGNTHFDNCETTIAHAFGLPHPALEMQRYGARLYDVFMERGLLEPGQSVVEIGPGDGELGEAFSAQAQGRLGEYIRLDASIELLATQRSRMPRTREILASATALPFANASIPFLFANEVIADLSSVPFDPDAPAERGDAGLEVAARLTRYRIKPLEGKNFYNLGAWRFLEEIARVLAPKGSAWLSEFGILEGAPEETIQLDHPEISIQFTLLCDVARALGLSVQCEPLSEFMGFDNQALQLWRGSYEGLRALQHRAGRSMAARAWTPETLPCSTEGLLWVPITEAGAGPLLSRFWCVLLRKV